MAWTYTALTDKATAKFIEITSDNGLVFINGTSSSTITLNIATVGFDTGASLTYKWFKKVNNAWNEISGATSSSYVVTGVSNVGAYKAQVTEGSDIYEDIVSIGAVSDGTNGTSPYLFSLSNENFSIGTDNSLKPLSYLDYDVVVTGYHGSTVMSAVAPSASVTSGKFKVTAPSSVGNVTVALQSDNKTVRFSTDATKAITSNQNFNIIITYYNDETGTPATETKTVTVSASKQGNKGDTGKSVSSVTEYYLTNNSSTAPTKPTSSSSLGSWKTTVTQVSSSNQYLWNCEIIKFSDNTETVTNPANIAKYVTNGSNGKGISSIANVYKLTTSTTKPDAPSATDAVWTGSATGSTSAWGTVCPTTTTTNKYLWNVERIAYTDNTYTVTAVELISTHGATGATGPSGTDMWTPLLTNVSRSGTKFTKNTNTSSWDSQFYSKEGFKRCYVSWKATQTNGAIMVGLNSDPTLNANWTSLDYAIYMKTDGTYDIRESNTTVASSSGSYTTSDVFRIEFDGTNVNYYKGSTLLRSVARAEGDLLYADSSFNTYNKSIQDVTFAALGEKGNEGFSPTATVSKSGNTTTISITDKNGTTTKTVTDGTNGTSPWTVNCTEPSVCLTCNTSRAVTTAKTITIKFNAFQGTTRKACTIATSTLPSGVTQTSNTAATTSADGTLVLTVASGANLGGTTTAYDNATITLTVTANSVAYTFSCNLSKQVTGATGGTGSRAPRYLGKYNSWKASTAYAVGNVVINNGDRKRYTCKTAHTSGSSFSATNWTANETYISGDWYFSLTDGKMYLAGSSTFAADTMAATNYRVLDAIQDIIAFAGDDNNSSKAGYTDCQNLAKNYTDSLIVGGLLAQKIFAQELTVGNFVKSSNYSASSGSAAGAGFKISSDGKAEFNELTVNGMKIKNTGNSDNVCIGYNTGYSTTGSGNVNIGASCMPSLTTGGRNVAIGKEALKIITTGSYNVAIGQGAGGSIASNGEGNVVIGSGSMANSSSTRMTGNNNTVIGKLSGTGLTTGAKNVFVGANVGDNVTTGSQNIFIGQDMASNNVSNTVSIGHSLSGYTSNIPNDSILIGVRISQPSSSTPSGRYINIGDRIVFKNGILYVTDPTSSMATSLDPDTTGTNFVKVLNVKDIESSLNYGGTYNGRKLVSIWDCSIGSTTGDIYFTSGMILKFGKIAASGEVNKRITFPTAFPSTCIQVHSNHGKNNTSSVYTREFAYNWDKSGFYIRTLGTDNPAFWFAFGY